MPFSCNECGGKGGFVIDDSAPDFCGDGEIEECHKCHGSGVVPCVVCGETAVTIRDDDFVCSECAGDVPEPPRGEDNYSRQRGWR